MKLAADLILWLAVAVVDVAACAPFALKARHRTAGKITVAIIAASGIAALLHLGPDVSRCECPEFRSGLPCGRVAMWRVQVGTRKADAQLSCGRHLSMTCTAMYEAEKPRKVALTVTAVTP